MSNAAMVIRYGLTCQRVHDSEALVLWHSGKEEEKKKRKTKENKEKTKRLQVK